MRKFGKNIITLVVAMNVLVTATYVGCINVYASHKLPVVEEKVRINDIFASKVLEEECDTEEGTDDLLVCMDGDVTDKQIKKAIDDFADNYHIIAGKFEIDKNLPIEKQKRLEKYLKSKNYKTIISVDVKDELNLSNVKSALEKKNVIETISYDKRSSSVSSYGVDDTYSSKQYHIGNINAKTAWTTFSKSGYTSVYVAVIDTGLYTSNKDFSGMYLKNYSISIKDKP